jgi:hypothetical protein
MVFQQLVSEYSALSAKLRELSAASKEVRVRLKDMQGPILQHMADHDIATVPLEDGTSIVRKQVRKTEGLKKEHIQGELRKVMGGEGGAVDETVANMFNRRATEVHETLAVVRRDADQGT